LIVANLKSDQLHAGVSFGRVSLLQSYETFLATVYKTQFYCHPGQSAAVAVAFTSPPSIPRPTTSDHSEIYNISP